MEHSLGCESRATVHHGTRFIRVIESEYVTELVGEVLHVAVPVQRSTLLEILTSVSVAL